MALHVLGYTLTRVMNIMGGQPVGAQKCVWSSVKIATEEIHQQNGNSAATVA